ncbi:MAG TPA: hypothetical protein VL463_14210 [Kofleriaceae bacterium]|nr:hypothetical protein [Kofleriaceae bacterium]
MSCAAVAHAVYDHAHAHAYVARDQQIVAIDLATCAETIVYTTPDTPADFCAVMTKDKPVHPLTDLVLALADHDTTLVLDRYGVGCHVPDHMHVRVTDFAAPARAKTHAERRIYSLATAGGVIVAVDGDGLLRSTDGGVTWTAIPVALPEDDVGALIGIAADTVAIDHDHLIVGTLALPEIGGAFSRGPTLRSDDGGATWTAVATKRPRRARSIRLGHDRFDATDDGVVRTHGRQTTRVTPETATAPSRDLFELYVLHPT